MTPVSSSTRSILSFIIRDDSGLDWQQGSRRNDKLSVRFGELLCNKFCSDMAFYVEQDDISIPAHRMIIGLSSDVLEAMVFGSGKLLGASDQDDRGIPVSDCSADDFYQVRNSYVSNLQLQSGIRNHDTNLYRCWNLIGTIQIVYQIMQRITY